MPAATFTDEEFISAWGRGGGSPIKVAAILGIKERGV
jgi:DNA-binding CsgD family transcriptional regulator